MMNHNLSLEVPKYDKVKPKSLHEASLLLDQELEKNILNNQIYSNLLKLGYEQTDPIVCLIMGEIERTSHECEYYNSYVNDYKWELREEKYPVATEIWLYMKSLGWSDEVCAGIIGNIMTEVGGQTLNIQYSLYDKSRDYYGMCQWSKKYYKEIFGKGLKKQCNFLRDTIQNEINMFGNNYSSEMNFDLFLKINTPEEAALIFAKCYERCASFSYEIRQENAKTAYQYFTK